MRMTPVLIMLFALTGCGVQAGSGGGTEMHVATLSGEAPIIIAHRGASGERPEHTLAAYRLAIEQGADFIEPDLVLTRDGILVARHENESSETGIYPETKHPGYFRALGLDHDESLLRLLKQYGYAGAADPVFIQSFEVGNLIALNRKTDIRLVQLVTSEGGPPDDEDVTYASMLTPAGLGKIASYADGIGPSKDLVIGRNAIGQLGEPTGLVAAAHKAGLLVHPWTFRRENYFLPTDFKSGIDPREPGDLTGEVRAFVAAGVDGLFSDNPEQAVTATKR